MHTIRDQIRDAAYADYVGVTDTIKTLFNCVKADVDEESGDVWIANPQQGHWLKDDGLARVARALQGGDT